MDYSLRRLHTKFGERAFSRAGPATWNALPDHIRTVADPVRFRKLLKSHYFSQAFNILTLCVYRISSWSGSIHTVHCRPDFLGRKPWSDTALICRRTQVYGSCPATNVDAFSAKLTACSCAVASWMQSNGLQLNSDKTEVLWCATTRRQHQLCRSPLLVDGTPINPV